MRDNEKHDPVLATDVAKVYGTRKAVDGVSLRVEAGQIFGLLGPNGAGKTTLLRMLAGLVRPSAGAVRVFGESPGAVLGRVGTLIEGPGMYPYLSGKDNLRVLARQCGVGKAAVDEALETVALTERGGDKFSAYSLGMKQRLGVAAALLKKPDLLVLDEPTNGLDPQGMRDMRDLVRELGAAGHTVLVSSHDLAEVQELCARVAVLHKGRIVRSGAVDELRGSGVVVLTGDPLDRAFRLARAMYGSRVSEVDGSLELDVTDEEIPELVAHLVADGFALRSVWRRETTLEDVFLRLTDTSSEIASGVSTEEEKFDVVVG